MPPLPRPSDYSLQHRAAPSFQLPSPLTETTGGTADTRVSPAQKHRGHVPSPTHPERSTNMEQYRSMTDEELISTLKKYGFSPGPILETTRKVYEKKLFEVERKRTRIQPSLGSYEKTQYDLPGRDTYTSKTHREDDDGDHHYQESYTVTKTFTDPSARQRIKGEEFQSRDQKYYSSYQNVSQVRPSYSASQTVEPRKPIREKQKEENPKNRFFPLWLQFLLLFLLVGFLAYVYFFVQETDDNPFKNIDN